MPLTKRTILRVTSLVCMLLIISGGIYGSIAIATSNNRPGPVNNAVLSDKPLTMGSPKYAGVNNLPVTQQSSSEITQYSSSYAPAPTNSNIEKSYASLQTDTKSSPSQASATPLQSNTDVNDPRVANSPLIQSIMPGAN